MHHVIVIAALGFGWLIAGFGAALIIGHALKHADSYEMHDHHDDDRY